MRRTRHLEHDDDEVEAEVKDAPVVEPQAISTTPPHPMAVFRVLKQAFREYMASGVAADITVTTPPTHAATAVTTVAGTVSVDKASGVQYPTTVTVILTQSSTVKGTQTPAVDQVTGAYTATFAANTCVAGTATATVSSTVPLETTTTPAFTLT